MTAMHMGPALRPLAAALLLLPACDSDSGGPAATQEVELRLAASSGVAPVARTAVPSLTLNRFRVVVAGVDLEPSSGEDGLGGPPALRDVPLDGGSVVLASPDVPPGTYTGLRFTLVEPTPEILSANPGWPVGATMEITGELDGAAFTLPLAVTAEVLRPLPVPVVVDTGAAAPPAIVATLVIGSWFQGPEGVLDPADPAARAAIEANARESLTGE